MEGVVKIAQIGPQILARDNAIGIRFLQSSDPKRAKVLTISTNLLVLLPLQGESCFLNGNPKAMPWARSFCPFGARIAADEFNRRTCQKSSARSIYSHR